MPRKWLSQVLGLMWQIVKATMMRQVNLKATPALIRLVGDAEDPEATPCMISPRSPSSSSSSSSSTSDSDGCNSSLDEAEHIVNPKSGVFHLKHEVEPGRLRCGRRLRRTFRSADFTAAYALEAHRCRKCHP